MNLEVAQHFHVLLLHVSSESEWETNSDNAMPYTKKLENRNRDGIWFLFPPNVFRSPCPSSQLNFLMKL